MSKSQVKGRYPCFWQLRFSCFFFKDFAAHLVIYVCVLISCSEYVVCAFTDFSFSPFTTLQFNLCYKRQEFFFSIKKNFFRICLILLAFLFLPFFRFNPNSIWEKYCVSKNISLILFLSAFIFYSKITDNSLVFSATLQIFCRKKF